MKYKELFRAFLKNAKQVGSIAPSSHFLAEKMAQDIKSSARCVVELGPGTGVITREIMKRLPESASLFVFELSADLVLKLKKEMNDPRIHIINADAREMRAYLKEKGFEYADNIISSIPLTAMKESLVSDLLKTIHETLKTDGGIYAQYQYSKSRLKNIRKLFETVDVSFEPRNLPPAFIYKCSK